MSKQHATLSKLRSTLSKQHSTLLPLTATKSNGSIVKCCWCGRGFYKVACCFDSVAWTFCCWYGRSLTKNTGGFSMSNARNQICLCASCVSHALVLCVLNRLNRSRCRLGADFCGSKEPCVRWGSRSDESIRSREGWQVGNAAFCQIALNACYHCHYYYYYYCNAAATTVSRTRCYDAPWRHHDVGHFTATTASCSSTTDAVRTSHSLHTIIGVTGALSYHSLFPTIKISPVRDWRSTPTYCQLQNHVTQKLGQK